MLELPVGVWLLVASARGYLPDSEDLVLRAGQSGASQNFALQHGGSTRPGTLVDLDGVPVAGVRVAARMSFGGRAHVLATSVQTNAEGHFELWANDDASLVVDAPGYLDEMVRDADIYTALPESALEGRVVDEAEQPVAGARVALVGRWDLPLGDPEYATLTDPEGRFRIGKVRPGNYDLLVYRENLGGSKEVSVPFAQTKADIEVVLALPLEWVRAQVVEDGTGPVAGCLVGLMPAGEPHAMGWMFYTDEDGRLDFPTRPGARFEVYLLRCPGKVGKPPYEPLVSGRPDAEVSRLEVAPGHVLRGRVVDTDAQPLAAVKVDVSKPELVDFEWMTRLTSARTNVEGWFEIEGLFPGQFEVQVEGRRRSGPPLHVTMTDRRTTEVTLTVEESARIETHPGQTHAWSSTVVHVADPAGQSVGRALVTFSAIDFRPTSTKWWGGEFAITDAYGRARFERGCNEAWACTAVAARPGMFGTATVAPGYSGEIEITLRPSGP